MDGGVSDSQVLGRSADKISIIYKKAHCQNELPFPHPGQGDWTKRSSLPNKLIPPDAYALIPRQRLLAQIEKTTNSGISWVVAPPGSGKSSLAATWLWQKQGRSQHGHGIWYRLEAADTIPSVFFKNMRRAIALQGDSSIDRLPELSPETFGELLTFAENWLQILIGRTARAPFFFVFDDLHHLPQDSEILEIIVTLAGMLRSDDRLICLSRQDPPSRFASTMGDRLTKISDLSIHAEEYEDFRCGSSQLCSLTKEVFLHKLRQSGQWISGLVLTAEQKSFLEESSFRERVIVAEILGSLKEEEQFALLATTFLQTGCDDEWRRLGGGIAPYALRRLCERGFVARHADGTLRKHDLFQEQMQAAAESKLTEQQLREARLCAGRLMVERDELLEGARLIIEAGGQDEVCKLIRDSGGSLISAGRNHEVLELIELLPEQSRSEPLVRVWSAYARLPFEPSRARQEFSELWHSLDPEADTEIYAHSVFGEVRAALANWSVDQRLLRLYECTNNIEDTIDRASDIARHRLTIARSLALLIGEPTHPDVAIARRAIEATLPALKPSHQLFAGSMLVRYLVWWSGELDCARDHLNTIKPLVGRSDLPLMSTLDWYYSALGLAFREGDDEALDRLSGEAESFAQQWGIRHRLSTSLWIVAQSQAARGDCDAAVETLHRYESLVGHSRRSGFSGSPSLRAALALCNGDVKRAKLEANEARKRAALTGSTQDIGAQDVLLAMALALEGDDNANVHINALRRLGGGTDANLFNLHALIAETFLAFAQECNDDFAWHWRQMATMACELNVRRFTGMNLLHLGRLANAALSYSCLREVTRSVIRLWRLSPPAVGRVQVGWPCPVEVRCFGEFKVQVNGKEIEVSKGKTQRKPLELLWLLIVANGRGLSQERIIDELWPDHEGERAAHTLRTTIYRLRKMLVADSVVQEDDHVRLDMKYITTDLSQFRKILACVQNERLSETERLSAVDNVLDLYRGPLLSDVELKTVAEERKCLPQMMTGEILTFLMTLDPGCPERVLRTERVRCLI